MRAIHFRFIPARDSREMRIRDDADTVKRLGHTLFVFPFVFDARPHFARDVLHQGAAEKNIEALDTEADCQDRLLFGKSMLDQREIGSVPVGIGLGSLGIPRNSK